MYWIFTGSPNGPTGSDIKQQQNYGCPNGWLSRIQMLAQACQKLSVLSAESQ